MDAQPAHVHTAAPHALLICGALLIITTRAHLLPQRPCLSLLSSACHL